MKLKTPEQQDIYLFLEKEQQKLEVISWILTSCQPHRVTTGDAEPRSAILRSPAKRVSFPSRDGHV